MKLFSIVFAIFAIFAVTGLAIAPLPPSSEQVKKNSIAVDPPKPATEDACNCKPPSGKPIMPIAPSPACNLVCHPTPLNRGLPPKSGILTFMDFFYR